MLVQNPLAPQSRSVGTKHLTITPGVSIGLKLYNTSVDKEGSGLHYSCPNCLQKSKQVNTCSNENCETDIILNEVAKVWQDGTENMPIRVTPEHLETLVIPVGEDEVIPFPQKDHFVIHARISMKDAVPHLLNQTAKYFLAPEKGSSITLYAALLEALSTKKQALMVKFCMRTQRQQLAIIAEEEGRLMMYVIPFQAQLRNPPEVKIPQVLDKRFAELFTKVLMDIPTTPYEQAEDHYEVAFNYLVENLLKAEMGKMLPGRKKKKAPPVDPMMSSLMQAVEALQNKSGKAVPKSKVTA
jgi:non-homologous end joining protein Ku